MSETVTSGPGPRPLGILLLFPHFNTLEQGSSLRSWQIGRFLASRGHTVTAFAPGVDLTTGQLFPEVEGRLYSEQDVDGVRLIRTYSLPGFRKSALRRFLFELIYASLASLRALWLRGIDVVVVSYPPAVLPVFGLLVAKLRRRPLIFEVRDLMADALEATGYVRSKSFIAFARRAERTVIRFSDHIVSVSPGIRRELVARGVPAEKISVVTNGYEPEPFEGADYSIDARAEYGWGHRFVVIYAGGLTQSYDVPCLLRAAVRLRDQDDMLFVIVGDGERRAEYERFCSAQGLSSCRFLGFQPRKRVPVLLTAADVGVHMFPDHPLWAYVLGNKLFDYFGSRLPVVYAGIGDMADLIRRSGGGFVVPPEDDEQLAAKLLYLRDHPEEARAMGERGRRFVLAHYNRRDLLQAFEEATIRVHGRRSGTLRAGDVASS